MPDPVMAGRSGRLRYEPLAVDHAAELAPLLTDPRVNAYFGDGWTRDERKLRVAFIRMLKGPGDRYPGEIWLNYLIRYEAYGQAIGRLEATIPAILSSTRTDL